MRHFPPINFNPNVPALFGQGLTDYEIIVRLCKKINDCIDDINSFIELVNKLQDILDDFEQAVQDEVTKAIKQMYEDGTLKQIVKDIVTPYALEELYNGIAKTETLDFRQMHRQIYYTGKNWSRAPEGQIWCNCQGGCTFTKDGTIYVAFVMHDIGNTRGRLMIYKNNSTSLVYYVDLTSAHAQTCVYNPSDDCFYIPVFQDVHYADGSYKKSAGVYRINFTTRAVELKNINTSDVDEVRWYSIKKAYNYELGKWEIYGFKNLSNFYHNNRNTMRMYKIDYDNGVGEWVDEYQLPNYAVLSGGRNVYLNANECLNDKYIFVATMRPNSILVYARSNDKDTISRERLPIWSYSLPDTLDYSYSLGEIEDFEVDSVGNMWLVTLNNFNADQRPNANIISTVVRMYRTNLVKGNSVSYLNGQNQASPHTAYWRWANSVPTLYVDWNVNYANPSGVTPEQAFKTCQEAVEFVKHCPYISEARINLMSDDYLPCFFATSKNIRLELNNHKIAGIYAKHSNILITNGIITQTSNYADYGKDNAPLYITDNTKCIASYIKFDSQANQLAGVKCNQDAFVSLSDCHFIGCTNASGGVMTSKNFRSRITN